MGCVIKVAHISALDQCVNIYISYFLVIFKLNCRQILKSLDYMSPIFKSKCSTYISLILLSARDFKIFLLSTIHTYIQQYIPYKNNNSIVRKLHRHNMIFSLIIGGDVDAS